MLLALECTEYVTPVATTNQYGSFATLSTPQIDDLNIWTEMNHYVSHTLTKTSLGQHLPSCK